MASAGDRYAHQSAFVEEILGGSKYDIFFGAFGTGILGIKKLCKDGTLSEEVEDHVIILFINVRGSGVNFVQKTTMNAFHNDSFDKESKALRWSSQACDRDSEKAQFIINHVSEGSPVFVAVRRNATGNFSLLGRAKRLVMAKEAHVLVSVGEGLLELTGAENGADKLHKALSANCLLFPQKLKSISVVKATEEIITSRRICLRCCCMPAQIDIEFDEINQDGLEMFEEEAAIKSKKIVKKKPLKERSMTRVSETVKKAQKKVEAQAKKLARKKKTKNEKNDHSLSRARDSQSTTPGLKQDNSPADSTVSRMDDDSFLLPKLVKSATPSTRKRKVNADRTVRRRIRGRCELLPEEIERLPPLPAGMSDILEDVLKKTALPPEDDVYGSGSVSEPETKENDVKVTSVEDKPPQKRKEAASASENGPLKKQKPKKASDKSVEE